MSEPILTLETLAPDPVLITIDGKSYEIRTADTVGIRMSAQLSKMQRKVNEIQSVENVSEGQMQKLADTLDEMVVFIVPGIEVDVLAKLRDQQKMKIVQTFTTASREMTEGQEGQQTSDSSSQDSSDSTEEIPEHGST